MPRRDQFVRCFRVLRLLARPGGCTIDELVRECGVCRRTMYRDLESLEACQVPIVEDDATWPKRLTVSRDFLDKVSFEPTLDELVMLHVLRTEIESLAGGVFRAQADGITAKVRSIVPGKLLERADALREHVGRVNTPRAPDTAVDGSVLMSAIESCETLVLDYESRSKTGRASRVVEPLGIATRHSALYLVARDVRRDEIRTYRASRIVGVKRTGERFQRPADFRIEDRFKDSFGVHGGAVQRVMVRFSATAAPYVRERTWHRSQVLRDGRDGSVTLTMDVSGLPEVKSWVQSFGADATVLEPHELAQAVHDDAVRVAAQRATSRSVRDSSRKRELHRAPRS